MTFQRVLNESGLTKVELAKLYGVSRQAVYYWRTVGITRTGSLTIRMADAITKALIIAIERRILPLGSMSKDARATRIAKMATTLQNLKPAPAK